MSRGLGATQRAVVTQLVEWGYNFDIRDEQVFEWYELSLTHVYAWVSAHKASIARALKSLEKGRYVERDGDNVTLTSKGLMAYADFIEKVKC